MIKKMKSDEYYSIPYTSASVINAYIRNPSLVKDRKLVIEHEASKAQLFGSLIHKRLLEKDEFEMNESIYMEMLTNKEKKIFEKCVNNLKKNTMAVKLLTDPSSVNEGVVSFKMKFNDKNIACKGRFDSYSKNQKILSEIKKTGFPLEDFPKEVEKYNYLNQLSFYAEGLEQSGFKVDLGAFIVVETIPPFETHVFLVPSSILATQELVWRPILEELHSDPRNRFKDDYSILE